MAKIPQHIRSVMASGNSGSVRANPAAMSDTGAVAANLAIGQAGAHALDAVSKASEALAVAEHRSLLSTAERKRTDRVNLALQQIEAQAVPEDISEFDQIKTKIWEAAQKDIDSFAPKVQWVADAYKQSNDAHLPGAMASFENIGRKKKLNAIKTANELNLAAAVHDGDFERVGNIAADNVATGIWTRAQGKAAIMQAHHDHQWQVAANNIKTDAAGELERLSGANWRQVYPYLNENDRAALIDDARTEQNYQQNKAQAQQKQDLEQAEGQIWNMFTQKTLTPSHIKEYFNEGIDLDGRKVKIDAKIRDDFMKRMNSVHPVITDRQVKFELTEAIHNYRRGRAQYDDVYKKLTDNMNNLSDSDFPALQKELYQAKEQSEGKKEKEFAIEQDEALDSAFAYGKSQILSQGMLGFEGEPVQYQKLDEYNKAIGDWVRNQKAAGKTPGSDDIYKKSRELVVHYRMTAEELANESMRDAQADDVRRQRKLAREAGFTDDELDEYFGKPEQTAQRPQRLQGESVAEFMERVMQVKQAQDKGRREGESEEDFIKRTLGK